MNLKRVYYNKLNQLDKHPLYQKFNKKIILPINNAYIKIKKNTISNFIRVALIWLMEILVISFIAVMISFFIINGTQQSQEPPFISALTDSQKKLKLAEYGLDQPLVKQFGNYLVNLLQGDLGVSYAVSPEKPIGDILWSRMSTTLVINMISIFLALGIGLPLGLILGVKPNGFIDSLSGILVAIIFATPGILVALYLLIIGRAIGIEYVFDKNDPETYILPVIALSIGSIASYIRYIRAELAEQLKSQHAKFAYLKGARKKRFLFKHAMKPVIFPVATYLPESLLISFIGSFVIERIFSIPGSGSLLLEGLQTNDVNLVLTIFLLTTALSVLAFRLRDILYNLVDPRMRKR